MIKLEGKSIYDLALRDTWWSKILRYPLAALFLLDFKLNWKHMEAELRGDFATNISGGLAMISGIIGRILALWQRK